MTTRQTQSRLLSLTTIRPGLLAGMLVPLLWFAIGCAQTGGSDGKAITGRSLPESCGELDWPALLTAARSYEPPLFEGSNHPLLRQLASAIGERKARSVRPFTDYEAYRWLWELAGHGPTGCEVHVIVYVPKGKQKIFVFCGDDDDRWRKATPGFVLTRDEAEFREFPADDSDLIEMENCRPPVNAVFE